jgi:hypothetical protein
MYAKFINENRIERFSARQLIKNGVVYANPKEDLLIRFGIKPLIEMPRPTPLDGEVVYPVYTENDTSIVKSYRKVNLMTGEENV